MNYKLICIDMDGTLLNRKHKVSEVSKKALRKAHDMGVHIVISTGRMYTDAEYYSNLIGIKSPIIASNGAIIKEKNRDEVIYKSVIDENLALKLLDIFKKYNAKPIFFTPEKAYCGSILYKFFIQYVKLKNIMDKSISVEFIPSWKQWNKIIKAEKDNIVKCEVIGRDEHKLKDIRAELEAFDEFEIASSSKHNMEVTCKGVSKGRAVEILAAYYNIDKSEIIAIGDSENDLSMIEFAGLGIAMGNAIDTVKQKAEYVTDTNDNDGVAKIINRLIKGE